MVQAKIQRAGQSFTASSGQLGQDTQLVVLIGPLDFLVEPHGHLRLARLRGHSIERAAGGRLLVAFTNELRTRQTIEGDDVNVAETHRLTSRQSRNSRSGLGVLHQTIGDASGKVLQIPGSKYSHLTVSFQ